MDALSNLELSLPNLEAMFRRLQSEAQEVFSRISTISQDLITVITNAVASQVSDKQEIVNNIRSEVLNLIEEDERLREFQTSVVNIFLIGAESAFGADPERINLMVNREEALQSQSEVARILIDEEIKDLVKAIDGKLKLMSNELAFIPTKEFTDPDKLNQCIIHISGMMSQKCVTEAQITILNTILAVKVDKSSKKNTIDNTIYAPNHDNLNNECNEFMLVLNNYRQQNTPDYSPNNDLTKNSSLNNDSLLESHLMSIRMDNKNKKARLSEALEDQRVETSQKDQKIENLRLWCEKAMTTMEKSYENLLQDLQHQHSKEKDTLRKEKDQALAEETQATLAALDAMRKAHESEVQKEVEKFKNEFLSDFQAKALQSGYQENREEIRREILSTVAGGAEVGPRDGNQEEGCKDVSRTGIRASNLSRSPSCPGLYSTLSLSIMSQEKAEIEEEPLRSPLTGMVADRKRVFENEY